MSKKEIIFITTNKYKFQVAQKSLTNSNFKLVQKKLETPEIQSESIEEISAFSAQWAANILKKPVAVSDSGCYIEALNGFPGPFIKFVRKWLSVDDLLNLLKTKKSRRIIWKDCLAYCEPGKKPKTFVCVFENGVLAKKPGKNKFRKYYSWIDSLYIPDGYSKPLCEWPEDEYLKFWSTPINYNSWEKLAKYIENKK